MCNGPFEPSGYFLKASLLHTGDSVSKYSDVAHNALNPKFKSFLMKDKKQPTVFRGYGALYLRNLLPSPQSLDVLFVRDAIVITENQIIQFKVDIPRKSIGNQLKVCLM